MSRVLVLAISMMLWWGWHPSAHAAGKPIRQLPSDVARWSTMWVAVPEGVVETGRERGTVAAVVWGPVHGMASFVRSAVQEVWDVATANTDDGRNGSGTALVRYEF